MASWCVMTAYALEKFKQGHHYIKQGREFLTDKARSLAALMEQDAMEWKKNKKLFRKRTKYPIQKYI